MTPDPHPTALRLTETLAAYLCHEMAGQVSTLAAVLDVGGEEGEALAMAHQAMARLRFLRAAWAGGGGPLDGRAMAKIATGLPGADRCRLDSTGMSGTLPAPAARIALCLLPVAVAALPQGGNIRLSAQLTISIDGPRAAWPASLAPCLEAPETAWSLIAETRGLPVPLACLLAARDGVALTIDSDSRITLRGS